MEEEISLADVVWLIAGNPAGLEALRPAREILASFGIPWMERLATGPDAASLRSENARAVIVASTDAALPGALAAATDRPVVRVPVAEGAHTGMALLHDAATADLPAGEISFATVAIGEAGAKNAALFLVSVLALDDPRLWAEWITFRQRQTDAVLAAPPLTLD